MKSRTAGSALNSARSVECSHRRDGGSLTDRYPHEPKPLSGLGMPKATPRLDVFRGRVLCCPSANGTPTRNGCRGSWRWPGSRTWNRRTATSGSCTCRGSTVSSRARRGRRGRRSWPWRTPADSTTSKSEVHERTVGRDNCVSFEGLALQLPGDRGCPNGSGRTSGWGTRLQLALFKYSSTMV